MNKISPETMLSTIVEAIQDKKGKNIVSIDMNQIDGAICSYFVVCNADSTTQVDAISTGIEQMLEERLGEKVHRVDGRGLSLWVAMDYIDIMVHIFQTELRDYYNIEGFWSEAPKTEYDYEL